MSRKRKKPSRNKDTHHRPKRQRRRHRKANPKIRCLGILTDGADVLIIQRKKVREGIDGARLAWAFPGGKKEEDETEEECVTREVSGEIDDAVEIVRRIGQCRHSQFPGGILVFYELRLKDRSRDRPIIRFHPSPEVQVSMWVSPDELVILAGTHISPPVQEFFDLNDERIRAIRAGEFGT